MRGASAAYSSSLEALEWGAKPRSGAASGAIPERAERDKGATRGHLILSGIVKRFGRDGVILQDVSLECHPGEFVVLVGPSGCGKSTLLNVAAGMIRPDGGTCTLDGKPFDAPGPSRTMVFQEHGLFPWLTAEQNVDFGLKMAGVPTAERRDRVAQVLEQVRLTKAAHKLPHELSGGMRQRVAIARALVMDPALLLMDEPFAALDAQTRTVLHEQLQDLWCATHKTILFVTHSVGEAVRLADKIVVMHAHPGRVRRVLPVGLSHPRDFDSPQLSELAHEVRREIEDEVNRIHAEEEAAEDHVEASGDRPRDPGRVGGGV